MHIWGQHHLQVHVRLSLGESDSPHRREDPVNPSGLARSLSWKCTTSLKIQGLEGLEQPQNLTSLIRSVQWHRNTLKMNFCLPRFSAAWVASEWTVWPPCWCLDGFASPTSTANHWQGNDINSLSILFLCPAWAFVHVFMERQFNADQINCICRMDLKHSTGSFSCRHCG